MLNAHENINHVTRMQFLCFFSPFLIIAFSCYTDQNLTVALICVVHMPIVSAFGFKRHIVNAHLTSRKWCKQVILPSQIHRNPAFLL